MYRRDDFVIPSRIVTHYSPNVGALGPIRQFPSLRSRSPLVSALLSSPVYLCRRGNYYQRNISTSNVARLIRKVRCNIRNYGTHFSRTGRNNEEKTAQLVTTYCAINGTARLRTLCVCVYVYLPRCTAHEISDLSGNCASCSICQLRLNLNNYTYNIQSVTKRKKYIGLHNISLEFLLLA